MLAAEDRSLSGTAWARGKILQTFAHLAWEQGGRHLAAGDEDVSAFARAYTDAYQAYR